MGNCKVFFPNKENYGNKAKLVEKEEIIDDDTNVAQELNSVLKTAVVSLDIHGNLYMVENVETMSKPVEKTIIKKKFRIPFKHFAY